MALEVRDFPLPGMHAAAMFVQMPCVAAMFSLFLEVSWPSRFVKGVSTIGRAGSLVLNYVHHLSPIVTEVTMQGCSFNVVVMMPHTQHAYIICIK